MQTNKIIEFFNWLNEKFNPSIKISKLFKILNIDDIPSLTGVLAWLLLCFYLITIGWISHILIKSYVTWSFLDLEDLRTLSLLIVIYLYTSTKIDKLYIAFGD